MALMEKDLIDLSLNEEEDEGIQFETEAKPQKSLYDLCLVGCCLTASVVHFPALKNTMANLWHPLVGIQISDLREKRYLFRFFYEVDVERVISGTPWTFNNHLLLLHRLQVHNFPPGYFSDYVAQQLGDFMGKFMEHDTKQGENEDMEEENEEVPLENSKGKKQHKSDSQARGRCTYEGGSGQGKPIGHNENPKLERPWIGESIER
ncbi:hypothetical protein Goshw_013275 [Gossypium schwendimanii]|uniref:DUF4283 domain-containing protein n=1 Tax=Gossypium schwendimanii TaxID=34291 RepID=A0A7J9L9L8_GOSSC|nr:hypothetical protein [Gossypium schwendimanii]